VKDNGTRKAPMSCVMLLCYYT